MPPSIITARRSRSLTRIAMLVIQPKNSPLALCSTTIKSSGNSAKLSNCRSLNRPATIKASSMNSAKLASGF